MKKVKGLNEKEILKKNPEAAKILAKNRKKLGGKVRMQREYGLGLPYSRPALVSSVDDDDDRTELYA